MYTLREEALVVSFYESKTVPKGMHLLQKVESFRKVRGIKTRVPLTDFGRELKAMTAIGLFDPSILPFKEKKLRRVDDINLYDPLKELYFSLTYAGYRAQLAIIDRLAAEAGDYRRFLTKKPGRS